MDTWIVDGKTTWRIRLRPTPPPSDRREGRESEPAARRQTAADFLSWWGARAEAVGLPRRRPTGEDFGIAARLLKKYGRDRLEKLAREFWLWHSEALRDYPHQMRLFAAKLQEIEAEVNDG